MTVRVGDLNWMQLEVTSCATTASCCRSARQSSTRTLARHRQHPLGALVGRGRRAARRPGAARPPVRHDAAFAAYPGALSLGLETYVASSRDLLGSLQGQGFRADPASSTATAATPGRPRSTVAGQGVHWHDWWSSDRDVASGGTSTPTRRTRRGGELPWTRLPGVELRPSGSHRSYGPRSETPVTWREALGDGSFGGLYQRSPEDESRPGRPQCGRSVRVLKTGTPASQPTQPRPPPTSSCGSSLARRS